RISKPTMRKPRATNRSASAEPIKPRPTIPTSVGWQVIPAESFAEEVFRIVFIVPGCAGPSSAHRLCQEEVGPLCDVQTMLRRQHAEGAVVQLVGRAGAGEGEQGVDQQVALRVDTRRLGAEAASLSPQLRHWGRLRPTDRCPEARGRLQWRFAHGPTRAT